MELYCKFMICIRKKYIYTHDIQFHSMGHLRLILLEFYIQGIINGNIDGVDIYIYITDHISNMFMGF